TDNLRNEYDLPIIYAGGVMSNKMIKNTLAKRSDTYFAESKYSSDNAAGIALLAAMKHTK
ncbi:MAG: peptidase M22, partial [Clostridia bacterium]|nr:peptidase M22 [Clostridia bacterium]